MSGTLCEHCTGVCCRYIALPLERPETRAEFDDIRWYLLHEHVFVFVEDGDWYIGFHTPCRHLLPDSRCGIYATRPRICRAYASDNCDYHSGDYGWEHHFTCAAHLDEYVRAHPPAAKSRNNGTARSVAQKRRAAGGRPRRSPAAGGDGRLDVRGVPLPVLPPGPNGKPVQPSAG